MEIQSVDSENVGEDSSEHAISPVATIKWNSLDLDCIKETIERLDRDGYDDTIHLVSFGGWNGPHLDAKLSATEWFQVWQESAGNVFHGIDWDLEGHDDLQSPTNIFTIQCLEKMGCISRLAKEKGYIIGMAPPQSYLDTASPKFSRSVNLVEPDRAWHPEFHYFGANVYAYLLANYENYIDFCSIQFYESYSRAAMSIYGPEKQSPEDYLESYVKNLVTQGETVQVNFAEDRSTGLGNMRVRLRLSKLVLGFANGWALDTGEKALFVVPQAIRKAYDNLLMGGKAPRGFMFWVIGEEGKNDISFTSALNSILQIRATSTCNSAPQEKEL